jgi:hypothetical protein
MGLVSTDDGWRMPDWLWEGSMHVIALRHTAVLDRSRSGAAPSSEATGPSSNTAIDTTSVGRSPRWTKPTGRRHDSLAPAAKRARASLQRRV